MLSSPKRHLVLPGLVLTIIDPSAKLSQMPAPSGAVNILTSAQTLSELVASVLRSKRVPPSVTTKVQAHVESVEQTYGIKSLKDLFQLPDWELWLVLCKSVLKEIHKILKREGYCHAVFYVVAALLSLDERIGNIVKEWVKDKCRAEMDPCCSNPPCCSIS